MAYASAVPAWGHLGDVTVGRARALQFGAIGAAVVVVLFALPVPMLVAATLVVAFHAFQSSMQPLADSLALEHIPVRGRDYGRVRLLASLSFAITAIACGVLYDSLGFWATAPVFAVAAVWICVSVVGLHDATRGPARRALPAPRGGRDERGRAQRVAVAPGDRRGGDGAPAAPAARPARDRTDPGRCPRELHVPAPADHGPRRWAGLVALAASISALAEVPGILLAGVVAARIGLRGLFAVGASSTRRASPAGSRSTISR